MHYKNGEMCMIGDVARGKPYNTKHEVVGSIVALNPESKDGSCGLVVGFSLHQPLHSWSQPARLLPKYFEDYGGCGDFELIYRPDFVLHIKQPHAVMVHWHEQEIWLPRQCPGIWVLAKLGSEPGRMILREAKSAPYQDEEIESGKTYALNDGDSFLDIPRGSFGGMRL